MRNAFADEITSLAGADDRVVLLSADIGNRLFDDFRRNCPDRFYNCGIAEANMISMAAGLAASGLRPVCYTITPFITTRCLEQIRVDVCYHDVPVVIVGTGSGLAYASLGSTHHSLEDLALLRALPGMRVLAPVDPMELRSCIRASLCSEHPTYMRIGKKGESCVWADPPGFTFGVWQQLRRGERLCFLASGAVIGLALEAAQLLEESALNPEVLACASVKPLDEAALGRIFSSFELVATLEEHGKIGGFGSAVAEWLADRPKPGGARLLRFGAADQFLHLTGDQASARDAIGLSPRKIADRVRAEMTTA